MKTTRKSGKDMAAKKVGNVKSPLKKSYIAPVHEPPTPDHRSPHGTNPEPHGAAKAKVKKGKADAKRRPRNKGRS